MQSFARGMALLLLLAPAGAAAGEAAVTQKPIADRKAVMATVEPVRQIVARARIGGTIAELKIREGDVVEAGQTVATVADEKLVLQMQALEQRIRSQQAQRDQARSDFERIQELQRRGVASQTQADQARTQLDIAERTLSAMQADRSVIAQQMSEGAVLASAAGRVLSVPVFVGRVVMPGETIATLAEENYILRLSLPERHARFLKAGETVQIGERGAAGESGAMRMGRVRLVYPEIQGGRVVADVEVEGLGDYFVGERTRVFLSTGERMAVTAPASALRQRAGAFFVRLKGGGEVVVQPGERMGEEVEILSGLRAGDIVVTP